MSFRKYVKQVNIKQRSEPKTDRHGVNNMDNSKSWLPTVYQGAYDRTTRYIQYDHMDFDVDVNMALDTTAEFCTLLDEYTGLPFVVNATSKITTTDIDIINTMLRKWCAINEWEGKVFDLFRNTIKYGDQVFIRDPETYVLYWTDIGSVSGIVADENNGRKPEYYFISDLTPNIQSKVATDNSEYFANSPLTGTMRRTARNISSSSYLDTNVTSQYPVEATHIVHCSTSNGMDGLWPFGRSVLDDVFKSFKQKELLEDAVIIYRVQRSPERLVFKVDTGDMNPKKSQIYLDQFAKNIRQKRTPVIDRSNGVTEMDTVYSPLSITQDFFFSNSIEGRGTQVETLPGGECFAMNTEIRLLDGRTMTINEIKERFEQDEQLWTYTIDKDTGVVCPGMISWAGFTRMNTEVVRLDFSDGSHVICTPDHQFPLPNNTFTRANDINIGQEFYNLNEKFSNNAIWYFDNKSKSWQKTSEMWDEFFKYEDLPLKHRMIVDEYEFNTPEYKDTITLVRRTELPNMDTGTITIDGGEFYTKNHTFPLANGVFTKNSTGTIDDLKFFTTRLMRGLRVPPSYMNWLSEDGQGQTYNDGKPGAAYMEEFKFNQYCMRLQRSIVKNLNKEFKLFLKRSKINIDYAEFDITFVKPQDFAEYRQIELDAAQLAVFQSVQETPYLSKRFVMKRFMGLSDAEIKENERLWKQENGVKFTLAKNDLGLDDVDIPEPSSEDISEISDMEDLDGDGDSSDDLGDFSFDEE